MDRNKAKIANLAAQMRQAAAWQRRKRLGKEEPVKKFIEEKMALLVPEPAPYAPPKTAIFTDKYKFMERLEKRGFKCLGSGFFSVVYGKPGYNRVIKINTKEDNFVDYCLWAAKAGYAGKFAPKMFSFRRHRGFRIMVLERLDKTLDRMERSHEFSLVSDLTYKAMDNNVMAELFLDEISPGLAPFLRAMKKEFPRAHDYHNGNWMVRGDQVVLTDPVSGQSKITQQRLKAGDFTPVIRLYYENINLWRTRLQRL